MTRVLMISLLGLLAACPLGLKERCEATCESCCVEGQCLASRSFTRGDAGNEAGLGRPCGRSGSQCLSCGEAQYCDLDTCVLLDAGVPPCPDLSALLPTFQVRVTPVDGCSEAPSATLSTWSFGSGGAVTIGTRRCTSVQVARSPSHEGSICALHVACNERDEQLRGNLSLSSSANRFTGRVELQTAGSCPRRALDVEATR